jgi:hypothetical protein
MQSGEFRVEEFKPPYVYDTAHKPEVVAVAGAPVVIGADRSTHPVLGYDATFTVTYKPADPSVASVNVTSVTLVAPSSTTHSVNMHQRVIRLLATVTADGHIEARTPLNPFIAPPGYYMLFLNNVKTYSTGAWVKLVDTTGAGKQVPKP